MAPQGVRQEAEADSTCHGREAKEGLPMLKDHGGWLAQDTCNFHPLRMRDSLQRNAGN